MSEPKDTPREIIDDFANAAHWTYTGIRWDKGYVEDATNRVQALIDEAITAKAALVERYEAALKEIATHDDNDHPCEHGMVSHCRDHVVDVARGVLAKLK